MDTAGSGLFVWIGRGCTKAEKLEAMNVAQKFLTEKGYPLWTKVFKSVNIKSNDIIGIISLFVQVNRVVDGGEPTIFKQYFASWKEETGGKEHVPVPMKNGRIAGKPNSKYDNRYNFKVDSRISSF